VLKEVMPIGSYATTVRRKALDFAAKIIYQSRKRIREFSRQTSVNMS
jgi:hypothetical protein